VTRRVAQGVASGHSPPNHTKVFTAQLQAHSLPGHVAGCVGYLCLRLVGNIVEVGGFIVLINSLH
jgi:hypothetical protein